MESDKVIGLKSRLKVIERAIASSDNPSEAILELRRYYQTQILLLSRKPAKRVELDAN